MSDKVIIEIELLYINNPDNLEEFMYVYSAKVRGITIRATDSDGLIDSLREIVNNFLPAH